MQIRMRVIPAQSGRSLEDESESLIRESYGTMKEKFDLNGELYRTILSDSKKLFKMSEEFDFESFEIIFDENTNEFMLKIITPDITFCDGRTGAFFEIIRHLSRFSFSYHSSSSICIVLVYADLLEEK